jgi:hypothetical protein
MRIRIAGLILAAAAVLLSASSSGARPADHIQGVFTYEEMKRLGLPTPPEPAELGLPACNLDPNWPGFKTAEEARQAAAAAAPEPSCAMDPRKSMYSVGFPNPAPGPP